LASCEQVKSFVQAHIDEELPNSERIIFEQHLSECRVCRASLEERKAAAAMLFEAFEPCRLRESLLPAVMAHLPVMDTPRPGRRDSSYRTTPHPERRRSRFVTLLPALAVLLLFLGLAILYSWPPLLPVKGEIIGKVTFLDGKAHCAPAGSMVRKDASLMGAVCAGQRYITSSKAQMMLALSGSTFVKIDGGSRLKIEDDRALSLESGRIWLKVGKDGRYFKVSTPNGDVTVFGTIFDVLVDNDQTVVTVVEGEVQVENDKSFTVLRPDTQVSVGLGETHLAPVVVDAKAQLAWAETIQADPEAEKAFYAEISAPDVRVMPAEQVFAVRTLGKSVSSVILEWEDDGITSGHCSYTVYVSDEKMDPLYRGTIGRDVFDNPSGNTHELKIENGPIQNVGVLHIKVVPNIRDEGYESTFSSVSAVSL
jgi:hypothetical protein